MTHAHTRALIDGWRAHRGQRRLPSRLDLAPLLSQPWRPQMLVLGLGEHGWRVRLSGALLDDLFGRALTGATFAGLWRTDERPAVALAQEQARRTREPVVVEAAGETVRARRAAFELTLAPAVGPAGAVDRMLALLQPTTPLAWLGGEPITSLRLCAGADAPPRGPRLVVDNTQHPPLG